LRRLQDSPLIHRSIAVGMENTLNPFDEFKLGQPKRWKVVYRGIEYPGEILVTDTWRAELGQLTERDIHFRIVVLTKHQRVADIADRRIACCIPGKASEEAKGIYGTDGKAKGLLPEQATLYADGRVLTKEGLAIDAREVFSTTDNEKRFHIIATALLANAYSTLPIPALEKTLSTNDVGRIFDGFFGRGDNPEARSALEDFSPALRLAKPENPYQFAPEDCPLFAVLAERLEASGGSLPIPELYRELASGYGLTWPLITLYLLCFVYYKKPEVELTLKPEHMLFLRSGEKPPGARLTGEIIPQIWWSSGMEEAFSSLCFSEQPPWNALLPYARLLCDELRPVANMGEVAGQEALLLRKLDELKVGIPRIKASLDLLSTKLGKPPQSMLETLERLSHITQSEDSLHFYSLLQENYSSPDAFAEDISQFQRLISLCDIAGEVIAVKSYLDGVVLRGSDAELAMDRVTILEQLNLSNLWPNIHLWASLKALFEWFQSRYQAIYTAHHHDYHSETTSLRLVLDDSKPEVDALKRLNSMTELGPPVAEELITQYDQLLAQVSPCPITEVPLELESTCPQCRLVLTDEPPHKEVERFLHHLRQALKEQQRRLSSEAVRQILAQSGQRRIDQFIKVVQASELWPLVNLLDDELVDFLRQLLQEAHIEIEWRPALAELAEKFPSLEEGDVDAAAAHFAELLRKAFAKAKRDYPGKRIRLSFKE